MTNEPRHRLLVVDDEAALVQALCSSLNDHGYDATGCASGHEAMALLRRMRFDVILVDLMMPGMDGISLLREALATDPFLVGVIMTGEGTIATAIKAMQSGALDYILKPFKLSAILPVLTRAIAMHSLQVDNAALEQSVRARTAELKASNRDLEAFAYSVSHDLRGPLHAIDGLARLLEQRMPAPVPAETGKLLRLLVGSVEHMRQLVDGLMRLSRMGQQGLEMQQVDMATLVRGVANDLQAQIAPEQLHLEIASTLPTIQADAALIKQLFANLLANAHKFSRHKAEPLVEVGVESDGSSQVFFVRDNGCGFDMAYADRLFKPFNRLHRAQEFEGTGIGLSIVQRIVERHGGRIWAQSVINEGTCFRFTLNAVPPASQA